MKILPNFQRGGGESGNPKIDADTANNFVQYNSGCKVVPWQFQWAVSNTENPGDNTTGAQDNWTTIYGSNDTIPKSAFGETNSIWVREVYDSDYVPFLGEVTTKGEGEVSAGLYCHTDGLHYDNYDRVDGLEVDGHYYCVAFNAKKPVEPTGPETVTHTLDLCTEADVTVELEKNWDDRTSGVITTLGGNFKIEKDQDGHTGYKVSLLKNSTKTWQGVKGTITLPASASAISVVPVLSGLDKLETPSNMSGAYHHDIAQVKPGETHVIEFELAVDSANDVFYIDFVKNCEGDNVQTATVQMCKVDGGNDNAPLAGWQLSLLGNKVETHTVNSKTNTHSSVVSTSALPAGSYVAKAGGTFEYRGGTGLLADARFAERQIGDPTYPTGSPTAPWNYASGSIPTQNGWLYMNNSNTVWGTTFSPAHTYYASLNGGAVASFFVGDNQHSDNVGDLTVDIYNGFTGVTGKNGCVTFEEVPYGTYQVEELLQSGWENVSGLGQVTVDSPSAVLTVVNKELDTTVPDEPIGRCELTDNERWGGDLVSENQGKTKAGNPVLAARSIKSNALDAIVGDSGVINYYSLGFGGEIVIEVQQPFTDGAGNDIKVYETSYGNPSFANYPEQAEVFVSADTTAWTSIGIAQHDAEFDLAGKYAGVVRYIKVVDTSDVNSSKFNGETDGFDLAGIEILGCDPAEPEPDHSISGTKTEVINEDGAAGEGWTIQLFKKVEGLFVDATSSAAVSSTTTLDSAETYLIKASGTYTFDSAKIRKADASYSTINGAWDDAANPHGTKLDLWVNGSAPDWGPYNDSHVYTLVMSGSDSLATFRIDDNPYYDNGGGLGVEIFVLDEETVTKNDGGYSFNNLEEGTYLVREVNQEGWTQILPETAHCEFTLTGGDGALNEECDFENRWDGETPQGGSNPSFSSFSRRGSVLGDRTPSLNDIDGEVLGASDSIYPGMPNAGNATPFASVIVVQSLLIAAALLFYNRKVFVTRTESN